MKFKIRYDESFSPSPNKDNKIYYRIEALTDFADVKKGTLGGFVENEENLSQKGNCWIYDDAIVHGNAKIGTFGNISSSSDYFVVGPLGSRGDFTIFYRSSEGEIMVNCGCYNDTISNFKSKVRDVHHDTIYEIQYNNAIEFAKKNIFYK